MAAFLPMSLCSKEGNNWPRTTAVPYVIIFSKWGGGGLMIKRIPWSDIAYGIAIAVFVLILMR